MLSFKFLTTSLKSVVIIYYCLFGSVYREKQVNIIRIKVQDGENFPSETWPDALGGTLISHHL